MAGPEAEHLGRRWFWFGSSLFFPIHVIAQTLASGRQPSSSWKERFIRMAGR